MADLRKEVIDNAIQKLNQKKQKLLEEISSIDSTINEFQAMLETVGIVSISSAKPSKRKARSARKAPTRVTENMVRDAILQIVANPVAHDNTNHTPNEGFFIVSELAAIIGCHPGNAVLGKSIKKFASKGVLESKPFKRGNQYRYIPVSESGPGLLPYSTSDSVSNGNGSEPVAGTGGGSIHIRDKDVEKMVRAAKGQGFSVVRTGSDHIRVFNPNNAKGTTLSATSNKSGHVTSVKSALIGIGVRL